MLEQGKLKYGDLLDKDEESSETSSEDDSEGELINETFETKFLEVITAIRAGDPSVLTKTGDNAIGEMVWKDEDFVAKPIVKKDKKVTLKDQIRQDALKKIKDGVSASESDEDGLFVKKGHTKADEQKKLK